MKVSPWFSCLQSVGCVMQVNLVAVDCNHTRMHARSDPQPISSVGTSDSSTSCSYTLYAANVLLQKDPCISSCELNIPLLVQRVELKIDIDLPTQQSKEFHKGLLHVDPPEPIHATVCTGCHILRVIFPITPEREETEVPTVQTGIGSRCHAGI